MIDKCPYCGHNFKKQYCKCENLTIFDLLYAFDDGKFTDYCKKCKKEIREIKAQLILSNPFGD